ncbi:hypothetical protein CA163_26155, partial [Vibrio parahaemolyticus]
VVVAMRHGMTDWLTLETQAEAKDDLIVAGLGFVSNAFNLGTVDASFRVSNFKDQSSSYALSYSYQSRLFSFAARTQVEQADFYTLSHLPNYEKLNKGEEASLKSRHVSQVNMG